MTTMASSPSLHIQHYPADPGTDTATDTKPTLILIHGGALSHRMYKDTIPHLTSRGYEVYAPDLPGHGDSAHLGPFTFPRATELLEGLIRDIQQQTSSSSSSSPGRPTPAGAKKVVFVGVSLGGQVVLSALQHFSSSTAVNTIAAAVVSGASIHPPDDSASWEMPHIPPADSAWMELMMADVAKIGMDNAGAVQKESLAFHFQPPPLPGDATSSKKLPPVCVLVGAGDVAMAKRDFEELVNLVGGEVVEAVVVDDGAQRDTARKGRKSRGMVVKDAWHNHPIDIPERFAEIVDDFVRDVL